MRPQALGLATTILLASATLAHAGDFQVSHLYNDTDMVIAFAYRWGNAPWTEAQLVPGQDFVLWSNRDFGDRPLFINFDADPGPAQDRVGYRLRTFLNPTTLLRGSPTEVFSVLPNGRIDILHNRP